MSAASASFFDSNTTRAPPRGSCSTRLTSPKAAKCARRASKSTPAGTSTTRTTVVLRVSSLLVQAPAPRPGIEPRPPRQRPRPLAGSNPMGCALVPGGSCPRTGGPSSPEATAFFFLASSVASIFFCSSILRLSCAAVFSSSFTLLGVSAGAAASGADDRGGGGGGALATPGQVARARAPAFPPVSPDCPRFLGMKSMTSRVAHSSRTKRLPSTASGLARAASACSDVAI
mmetsp:Transcript_11081/g.26284  ORF Transcript_11081/g.26284 Transcript_11081/m.26284 type:complete len:230 (-) Transcript_11081:1483-2172(-)